MKMLVALALAGCVIRNDITHVVLRDPARVAVANILPIGSARGDIPATVPPYIDSAEVGSWVERDGSDVSDPLEPATPAALVAWCPHCIGTRRLVVVDRPAFDLHGTADELLRWDGDDLHIRWMFDAARRRGRHYVHVPRFALDLVTPRSNVESIDYEARVQRTQDDSSFELGGMVWMGLWAAGGSALLGVGVHERDVGLEVGGAAMMAIGITAVSLIARIYRARDEHHPITVR